jgi:universal stress protein E
MTKARPVRIILAAVADPRAGAQVAARKAVELAWLAGADVVLYHACYEPSLASGAFFDSPGRSRARRECLASVKAALEEQAAVLAGEDLQIRVRVEWNRAIADSVARAAQREAADLVVAEPRFRASGRRPRLSHTDWELARVCPVPLLLARTAAAYSQPHVIAAVDPGGHGLRPSGLDAVIVDLAASFAAATRGRVSVLHCTPAPIGHLTVRPQPTREERLRTETLVKRLARDAGLATRSARVILAQPAEGIVAAVDAEDADLLVMGTVVRGPVARLLIGSTAERVIHEAPCDLLLVKPGLRPLALDPSRR